MEAEEYELMYRVEDHHWWYRGMAKITKGILARELGTNGKDRSILDAGCGTGAFLKQLNEFGQGVGVDFSPLALTFCKRRGLSRLSRASVTDLPFADQSFDLVTSFDVLSECGEGADARGLAEFFRVLKPGGVVVLRLPAYDWLRGKHDEAVHTRRRYSKKTLGKILRDSGFRVRRMTYANMLLFPVAAAKRLSERIIKPKAEGSDLSESTGFVNKVLGGVLSCEAPLIRSIGLPFGLTLVGVAEKPAG